MVGSGTRVKRFAYTEFDRRDVAQIDTALVMRCLEPIWRSKTETAGRVRGRIEQVLDWATGTAIRKGRTLRADAGISTSSLARLAAKYEPEVDLDDLLARLTQDCPWRDDQKPLWKTGCGVRLADLPPRRPPDLPGRPLRVVQGGKR